MAYFLVTILLAFLVAILLMMQDVPFSNDLVLGEGEYDMSGLVAPVSTGTLLQILSGNVSVYYFPSWNNVLLFVMRGSFAFESSIDPETITK